LYHEIEILGRGQVEDAFSCTEASGHYIAEDAGSTPGWQRIKEGYKAAKPNKEQKETMKWFESMARDADPKGLKGRENFVDIEAINIRLCILS
jgi:hypothetical protein